MISWLFQVKLLFLHSPHLKKYLMNETRVYIKTFAKNCIHLHRTSLFLHMFFYCTCFDVQIFIAHISGHFYDTYNIFIARTKILTARVLPHKFFSNRTSFYLPHVQPYDTVFLKHEVIVLTMTMEFDYNTVFKIFVL